MDNIIYNILTLIIVASAFFLMGRKIYHNVKKTDKSQCESGCDGCTTKCDLKEIVQKHNTTL